MACAPGVWCAEVPAHTLAPWTHTRAAVLGTGGVGWLVDPGGAGAEAAAAVDALLRASGVRTLKGILLTHNHRDHIEGVEGVLARHGPLPVLLHPAGTRRLAERLPEVATIPLEGGRRLMGGGEVIEALHTPGHASDHLAFWLPGSRTLIAGDLVSGRGSTWVGTPDGDVTAYLASLARATALAPALIVPAHGPLRHDGGAVLDAARGHRLAREREIWRALGAGGMGLAGLREGLYPELPSVARDFADRAILAHLLKLMREGRVMHAGEDSQGPYLRSPGAELAAP
jgi:endoribonuclease LACTB2